MKKNIYLLLLFLFVIIFSARAEFPIKEEKITISLIDILGREVQNMVNHESTNNIILNIDNLSDGLYHLVIKVGDEKPLVKKFVKKKKLRSLDFLGMQNK